MIPTASDFPAKTVIVASADASDHFGITRFSMTNEKRDELAAKVIPFVPGMPGYATNPLNAPGKAAERHARLKQIAEECFPSSELEKLRATMHGKTICPFIIENLPKDTWSEDKAASYRKSPQARQFMIDIISEAIMAATDVKHAHRELLTRRVQDHHNKEMVFKGTDMHTDGFSASMLSTVMNEEHANLQLIDLASVLRAMPKNAQDKIDIAVEYTQFLSPESGYGPSSLSDLSPDQIIPYTVVTINREDSDPMALAMFDRLLKEHTIDIDLQPGQLLCASNTRIYHKGNKGTLLPSHTDPKQFTRVLAGNFGNL